MSFLTVGGYPAICAIVTMPLVGGWVVEADVDAPEELGGTTAVSAPGLELRGTVTASSEWGGRVRVIVRPGAGRLSQQLPARYFRGATHRQIVQETLREAGEALDDSSLPTVAPRYARAAGTGGALVAFVASALGLAWGCLDDGRVSLFQPAFDAMLIDGAEVLEDDATIGRLTLGTTLLAARPGYRIEGRDATCVRHVLGDVVRTEVFYA